MTTTTTSVDTALRARANMKADDAIDLAITPIRGLIAKGSASSMASITAKLDAFQQDLRTFLVPIFQTEEIEEFLGTEAAQTIVSEF